MENKVEDTIKERGKVYGDPHDSHVNIGLAWTGLIQQHYGISLPHPLPAYVVALMMVDFKASRAVRSESPPHDDNYVDMEAYKLFAQTFEKRFKEAGAHGMAPASDLSDKSKEVPVYGIFQDTQGNGYCANCGKRFDAGCTDWHLSDVCGQWFYTCKSK